MSILYIQYYMLILRTHWEQVIHFILFLGFSQKELADNVFWNIHFRDEQDEALCGESIFMDKPDQLDYVNMDKGKS